MKIFMEEDSMKKHYHLTDIAKKLGIGLTTLKRWKKEGLLLYDQRNGENSTFSRKQYIQCCFDIYYYGEPFHYDLIS